MERPPIPRPAALPSSAPSRADPSSDDLRYLMQQYADAPRSRREAALYCPDCRENLVPARAELAMATRGCPACRHALFATRRCT